MTTVTLVLFIMKMMILMTKDMITIIARTLVIQMMATKIKWLDNISYKS